MFEEILAECNDLQEYGEESVFMENADEAIDLSSNEILKSLRDAIAHNKTLSWFDEEMMADAKNAQITDDCVFEDIKTAEPENTSDVPNLLAPPVKRGRGRPKKEQTTDDQFFEDTLFKAYDVKCNEHGKLSFVRNGTPLTLEETAYLLWCNEGKKTSKPLTKMGILKVEKNALDKLRKEFAKCGIKNLDDVFECNKRQHANAIGVMQYDS